MGRGQENERMVLECKFGKLVCEVVRDDEEYKEFAIDLYRNDGKAVQVCVVGTNERDQGHFFDKTCIHVDLWNGEDQDCDSRHYTESFGNGWWGEETI